MTRERSAFACLAARCIVLNSPFCAQIDKELLGLTFVQELVWQYFSHAEPIVRWLSPACAACARL